MSYHPLFPIGFLVDDIVTYDTLYSFLYLSFSFRGFSCKVFDEAMPIQSYMLDHQVFPIGDFWKMIYEHIDHMVKVLLD
jgi:hypothetical protein